MIYITCQKGEKYEIVEKIHQKYDCGKLCKANVENNVKHKKLKNDILSNYNLKN